MELTLAHTGKQQQVAVAVNRRFSHHFDLFALAPDDHNPDSPPQPLLDPQAFGRAVFQALFPPTSPAAEALASRPDRILLVATGKALQNIPWEYAYSEAGGCLVCQYPFVRALPPEKRRPAPDLSDTALHITAVPSDPLHPDLPQLAIEAEWLRLAQVVDEEGGGITLERVRPPTLQQLRRQVAAHSLRVIHFMGHGGHGDDGAMLLFEKTDGGRDPIAARDFVDRVGENAFLVTLNACVTATPGATQFDNVARALIDHGVPYALGMRFSIRDDDARLFSRTFYSDLAAGVPVEKALRQARLALAKDGQPYAVGVPVLYTSLAAAAGRFEHHDGPAAIDDRRQVKVQLEALPRIDGLFHGRAPELLAIGARLTADQPPRLLTIHGVGGQGKTAIARQAAERFSFPFRAGVYAANLESLPTREEFVAGLARFLEINLDDYPHAADLQREVTNRLNTRRLLLILDNAETLLQAVDREEDGPRALMQFIRQQLSLPTVTLLVTSRRWTDWPHEERLELDGLPPKDGAQLFRAGTPNRSQTYSMAEARQLSAKLAGHPLSLRLLASAYNEAGTLPFTPFIAQYEAHLLSAQDLLQDPQHRHRSLAASIKISVDFLPDDARDLLSALWVFHGPFLPEMAVMFFDLDRENTEQSEVPKHLALLHRRGLLAAERPTFRAGRALLYRLLPSLRPYIAQMLQAVEQKELLARFGQVMAVNLVYINDNIKRGGLPVFLAQQGLEDLERGLVNVVGETAVAYRRRLGWVVQRLGDRDRGLELLQQALALAGDDYPQERLHTLNDMAGVYYAIGQPAEALRLYEEALPIIRKVGDRAGEATTLSNMAEVYRATGRTAEALRLYEEALPITDEVGDHSGKVNTLNNMAGVYYATGRQAEALRIFEEVLPIRRKVGNHAGEASTLNNMGLVYRATGRPAEALRLYEEALPIMREVGDRAGEATTLNNMAEVYRTMEQSSEALRLFKEALDIMRQVGDRAGEAKALNNMGLLFWETERPTEALRLYEEALPIMHEVGDRAGEAKTLVNMGLVHRATGRSVEALRLYEEALPIMCEAGDRAGEATTLLNTALLLTQVERMPEAIQQLKNAIAVMRDTRLKHDASGATLVQYKYILEKLQAGEPLSAPDQVLQANDLQQALLTFVNANVLKVKRQVVQGKQEHLLSQGAHERLAKQIAGFENSNNQDMAEALRWHQTLLHRCVELGIDAAFAELEPSLPFPPDLPARAAAALRGDNALKLQLAQELSRLSAAVNEDQPLQAFYNALQNAIFGVDLDSTGKNLEGIYREIWNQIITEVTNN